MSIKLVITDPHTHGPIELRALSHYFACMASDKESPALATSTTRVQVGDLVTETKQAILARESFIDKQGKEVGYAETGEARGPVERMAQTARDMDYRPEEIGDAPGGAAEAAWLAGQDAPAEVFGGGKPSEATDPATPASDAPTPSDASSPAAASTGNPSTDAVPGVTVDKRGLPWDARIHASSKAINQTDGLWRAKRGIDPAIVPGVEAELRALMAIPAPEVDDDDLPPPIPDEDDDAPPPIPDDEPAGAPKTLGELMLLATAAVTAGRLQMTELTAAAKELGVAGLPLLGARPDLVGKVYEMLKDKLV